MAVANELIDVAGVVSPIPGISEAAHAAEAVSKVAHVAEEVEKAEVATKEVLAVRNAHLAEDVHPKTGIPFDKKGFPDFSSVSKAEVKIKQTGTRAGDFREANKAAGFESTPKGYTWHHHQDGETMQLVPRDIHAQTGHTGGFQSGP
jgi:hypothetical protein